MGKTTAEVMPKISTMQCWRAQADSVAFSILSFFGHFIVMVFFVGDVLMSARLILIGHSRHHRPPARIANRSRPALRRRVAVLVPAYNEETVIVRTVRSVLNSDYRTCMSS
jgi:cellulose synthase/poly-beta-1,6-N-acetylglucosamine synthase-like glycosyltransferase